MFLSLALGYALLRERQRRHDLEARVLAHAAAMEADAAEIEGTELAGANVEARQIVQDGVVEILRQLASDARGLVGPSET